MVEISTSPDQEQRSGLQKNLEGLRNMEVSIVMGVPPELDGLFQGKSQSKMEDDWGYPYFTQPPYLLRTKLSYQPENCWIHRPNGPKGQGTANKFSGRHGVIHVTGKTSSCPTQMVITGLIWIKSRWNVLQLLLPYLPVIWGKVSRKPYLYIYYIYIYIHIHTMKSALEKVDPGMLQALERALWTSHMSILAADEHVDVV